MNDLIRVSFLVCTVFVWPLVAEATQVQLNPIMDTTLYEDDQGASANGSGQYLFFGKVGPSGGNKVRRTLIKFDVSSIPPNVIIDQVSLSVKINQIPMTDPRGGLASLHRVTAPWGEGTSVANGSQGEGTAPAAGDATWLHRLYPDDLWSTAGGDFQLTPSVQEEYGVAREELVFTSSQALRQDVKDWVSNPADNHGWIMRGDESFVFTARRIFSRESTDPAVPLLTVDYSPNPTANLALTEMASGLNRPVAIVNANDGSGRLFIVEQTGKIRILDLATQTVLATPYLDLGSIIVGGTSGEQGLLGLAFHPDFINNKKFYVYYIGQPESGPDHSVVAMYQQNEVTPNVAVNTGTVLLEFEQDWSNHNGGDMHFDADGYLNIASGDGGKSGDFFKNAQNVNALKGKILRIDVDGTPPGNGELCGLVKNYAIPAGNAFPGENDGCDEILHLGLRNPWKFSFDAQTEEMYIGDVGQASREEVNYAAKGAAGLNFGWPCREGKIPYTNPPAGVTCPNPVEPIFDYPRPGYPDECSITGGYVYRGSNANMVGHYVYGDYCSSRIWLAKKMNNSWDSVEWQAAAPVLDRLSAFGQDEQCELYVADLNAGKIFRIDDNEMVQRSGFESLRCQ